VNIILFPKCRVINNKTKYWR